MKTYDQQKYPFSQRLLIQWRDGLFHFDSGKGLNQGHILYLARKNWPGAKITPLTQRPTATH